MCFCLHHCVCVLLRVFLFQVFILCLLQRTKKKGSKKPRSPAWNQRKTKKNRRKTETLRKQAPFCAPAFSSESTPFKTRAWTCGCSSSTLGCCRGSRVPCSVWKEPPWDWDDQLWNPAPSLGLISVVPFMGSFLCPPGQLRERTSCIC